MYIILFVLTMQPVQITANIYEMYSTTNYFFFQIRKYLM